MRDILCCYSNYSVKFVIAALQVKGFRVVRESVQASVTRVRGVQPRFRMETALLA